VATTSLLKFPPVISNFTLVTVLSSVAVAPTKVEPPKVVPLAGKTTAVVGGVLSTVTEIEGLLLQFPAVLQATLWKE